MIVRIRRTEREQAASVFFPGVLLIDVIAYPLKLNHVTFARLIHQLLQKCGLMSCRSCAGGIRK